MKLSLHNFKKEFLDGVLEFLWRQWSVMGVSGHVETRNGRVIDPEALLIFTTVFGRYEPRLFDEVLDWLRLNGDLINLQRLNNLQSHDFGNLQVLAAMADQMGDKAVLRKWKRVADLASKYGGNEPAPLFQTNDGAKLPVFGPKDERFANLGLMRGKLKFRGLSQRPNTARPENFLFKLRAFFGLNARSEVILYLLTHSVSHPRRIAAQIGYSPRTVENTLNEMEPSGLVHGQRQAREKLFWLKPEDWEFLTMGKTPTWSNWTFLLSSSHRIWKAIERPAMAQASVLLQASEIRKVMEKISKEAAPAGHQEWLSLTPGLAGEAYLEAVLGKTLSLFKQL